MSASALLRPTRHLSLELLSSWSWLDVAAPDGGTARLFTAQVQRAKVLYNFSARLYLRVIGEYVDERRDPDLYAGAGVRAVGLLLGLRPPRLSAQLADRPLRRVWRRSRGAAFGPPGPHRPAVLREAVVRVPALIPSLRGTLVRMRASSASLLARLPPGPRGLPVPRPRRGLAAHRPPGRRRALAGRRPSRSARRVPGHRRRRPVSLRRRRGTLGAALPRLPPARHEPRRPRGRARRHAVRRLLGGAGRGRRGRPQRRRRAHLHGAPRPRRPGSARAGPGRGRSPGPGGGDPRRRLPHGGRGRHLEPHQPRRPCGDPQRELGGHRSPRPPRGLRRHLAPALEDVRCRRHLAASQDGHDRRLRRHDPEPRPAGPRHGLRHRLQRHLPLPERGRPVVARPRHPFEQPAHPGLRPGPRAAGHALRGHHRRPLAQRRRLRFLAAPHRARTWWSTRSCPFRTGSCCSAPTARECCAAGTPDGPSRRRTTASPRGSSPRSWLRPGAA